LGFGSLDGEKPAEKRSGGFPSGLAMERSTMLLIGKPSISMGHLYHGYVK